MFLRTGLATRDTARAMIAAARSLHPDRPGELDLPSWSVGRTWCHASAPDCRACALSHVCPKLVDRAADVKGVGAP